jgi:transcriptional regulator with XRE-family HTH domain
MAPKNQNKLFSHVLAELRSALQNEKITQKDIGNALHLKQSAVSTLLAGKSILNLQQFLILCELLGIDPSTILQRASRRGQQEVPMSVEIQRVLYQSENHILLYAAASREIHPKDIVIENLSPERIDQMLSDLVNVGLLKKKGNRYIQKDPHIVYRAPSRLANSKLHQDIVCRSWRIFDRKLDDREYLKDKFNYYLVDRFTASQINEIHNTLWKVFEKIASIQETNLLANYNHKEAMPLWNIHMMLMQPIAPLEF